MTLKSRLKGAAISALVGPAGDRVREAAAELQRRVRRQPRAVEFFHDPTDPMSYLLAQVVARLAARYPVEWRFRAVSAPASDVDPQPALRVGQAVRDAKDIAAFWDVDFPPNARELDATTARWCGSVLVRERPFEDQLRAALDVGAAAWKLDKEELQKKVGAWGHEAHVAVAPGLATNYEKLREAGHYCGGTLHYGGEWYRGIDRVRYLEAKLAEDTGVEIGSGVMQARPAASRPPALLGKPPLVLDVWYSFRSPYSYLAAERIGELTQGFPIELRWRPVLPLADRGMVPPRSKTILLARDAAREAGRLGIPFGQISDPLGKGAEHCLAIARRAIELGKGTEFIQSAGRAIWAEALDMASYVDLRTVVERAGLDWEDAKTAIADEGWRTWVKLNAEDLVAINLYGVPSFRVGDYATWGQDRIDLIADRLRRHLAAPPATEAPPA